MMLFSVILLLALNITPSEMAHPPETQRGAVRPVVTLTPNWRNILWGDSVTLTCHVTSAAPEDPPYHWYRDNRPIPGDQRSLVIESSREEHSGDYQCRSRTSDTSHPVTLLVINAPLILQTPPPPIYEGDPLTLRCHHWREDIYSEISTTFYRNGEEIPSLSSELRIHNPTINSSGTYRCTKLIQDQRYNTDHEVSAETVITVRAKAFPVAIIAGTTAGVVVVIIIFSILIWRCKKRASHPCGERHPAISRTADPDQQDVCYTYLDIRSLNRVSEGNNAENDLNVTYATVKKN